jgi:hypothetical protein
MISGQDLYLAWPLPPYHSTIYVCVLIPQTVYLLYPDLIPHFYLSVQCNEYLNNPSYG